LHGESEVEKIYFVELCTSTGNKPIRIMKNINTRQTLLFGASSIAAVALVVYLAGKRKRSNRNRRLNRIADEGYETAQDILYPISTKRMRKAR
jgi:hypothetical protein